MRSSLVVLAESSEHAAQGIPPIGYGLIAFAILIVLLLVTTAFRSVWTRHR